MCDARLGEVLDEMDRQQMWEDTMLVVWTDHGFLLSTKRYGNKLTRKDMMQMIRNTTKDRLGLNIGIQMIRVLKTTDHFKSIDESAKLRGELAHGAGMQWKYVSRAD